MGIGTSLGAYYEDQFKHESGVEVIEPPKTGDKDMEVQPKTLDDRKKFAPGTIPASSTSSSYIGELGAEDDLSFDRTEPIGRRDEAGVTRYHTDPKKFPVAPEEESYTLPDNPHLFIRKKKDSKPSEGTPMSSLPIVLASDKYGEEGFKQTQQEVRPEPYGLNPPDRETPFPRPKLTDMIKSFEELTGKFKKGYEEGMTDDESLKLALEMVPWALGVPPVAGKIATDIAATHATKKLVQEAIPAIQDLGAETTGGRQVSEAIAAIRARGRERMEPVDYTPDGRPLFGRNSVFTEEEHAAMAARERAHPRNSTNPDALSDADFYTYGEYRGLSDMTDAQNARWDRIDRHYAEQMTHGHENHDIFRQVPFEEPPSITYGRAAKDAQSFYDRAKEGMKKKELNFITTPGEKAYGTHYFANENGVGEINAHYNPNSKTIRVHDISLVMKPDGERIPALSYEAYKEGPQTFGGKATKQILKYLKEQYPDAEWISGYRVSGARAKTGSGSADARMWIGDGPRPRPNRTQPTRRTIDEMLDQENTN